MSDSQDILVPDIGDFDSVDVIEVLVSPGDTVDVESPLITLESDKATMDVPSPVAGTVTEVRIAVGDQVSQGSLVAVVAATESSAQDTSAQAPAGPKDGAEASEDRPKEEATERTAQAPAQTDAPPQSDSEAPVPKEPNPTPPPAPRPPPSLPPVTESDSGPLPHASPAIRRFARELGADLSRSTAPARMAGSSKKTSRSSSNRRYRKAEPAGMVPACRRYLRLIFPAGVLLQPNLCRGSSEFPDGICSGPG